MCRWQRITPVRIGDPGFRALAEALHTPELRASLAQSETDARYPTQALEALRAAGLSELLTDQFTAHHIYGLNALVAQENGSLGITVGVIMLGLLPIHLGADAVQRRELLDRVRAGAGVALLLTEWERGSDLKTNQTQAVRGVLEAGQFVVSQEAASHYRVRGEKHLINAAAHSELLVTLVRTQTASAHDSRSLLGASGDMSVLVISPGEGVVQLPRYRTMPMHAAEIGGVRFDDAVVPVSRRLGEEGQGFALMQRALSISRGGIGALAAGTSARAFALARTYAHERLLYGAPIAALDPIAEHLVRMDALDLAVSCLSVKAACLVNAIGPAAAHHTALAKYACCELAEQAVDEGRKVMSARALVEGEYACVVRDVLLYAVFDGTRHVMLQQLQWRLRQMAQRAVNRDSDVLGLLRRVYSSAPSSIADVGRLREPAYVPDPIGQLHALAQLPGDVDLSGLALLATGLRELSRALIERGAWEADQDVAFVAGRGLALLETAISIAELADPVRRDALGMPGLDEPLAVERARFAIGFIAGQATSELIALAAAQQVLPSRELTNAHSVLWGMTGAARPALRTLVRERWIDERSA